MGISPFSHWNEAEEVSGNPNPLRFIIKNVEQHGDFLIAIIKYPDCTNFSGYKICIYEGIGIRDLDNTCFLDPHFSKNEMSPIARFKPTNDNLKRARKFCKMLIKGE